MPKTASQKQSLPPIGEVSDEIGSLAKSPRKEDRLKAETLLLDNVKERVDELTRLMRSKSKKLNKVVTYERLKDIQDCLTNIRTAIEAQKALLSTNIAFPYADDVLRPLSVSTLSALSETRDRAKDIVFLLEQGMNCKLIKVTMPKRVARSKGSPRTSTTSGGRKLQHQSTAY